jgi:hypothetical protein
LSETNHNTLTGYTHMARVALNFGVGGHFGAVQWMDLQLSPTTTITIFLTKHLQARAAAAPRVLRARGVLPIGMRKARAGSKNRGRRRYSRHGGGCLTESNIHHPHHHHHTPTDHPIQMTHGTFPLDTAPVSVREGTVVAGYTQVPSDEVYGG